MVVNGSLKTKCAIKDSVRIKTKILEMQYVPTADEKLIKSLRCSYDMHAKKFSFRSVTLKLKLMYKANFSLKKERKLAETWPAEGQLKTREGHIWQPNFGGKYFQEIKKKI